MTTTKTALVVLSLISPPMASLAQDFCESHFDVPTHLAPCVSEVETENINWWNWYQFESGDPLLVQSTWISPSGSTLILSPGSAFTIETETENGIWTIVMEFSAGSNPALCSYTLSVTPRSKPNPGLGNLPPLCVSDAGYPDYEITSSLSPSPGLPADDGIANWDIDWGNGNDTTFTEYTPAILGGYIGSTYNDYGYYTVTVEVTGDNGCVTTVSDSLFVGNNPLISSANPGNTTGICSPYTLTFPISNFAGNADGTTYLIDFGDGSTHTFIHDNDLPNAPPSSVTHEYTSGTCGGTTQSGLFDNAITFTIIATNECESSSASVEPIRIHTPPEPSIHGPNGVCVNGTWNYSVTGNGDIVTSSGCSNAPASWVITPQDGQANPTPYFGFDSVWSTTYPAPGEYLITTQSAHPNCGTAESNMTVCVYPDIQAVGQVTPLGSCAPLPVTLADLTPDPPLCGSPSTTWTISGPGGFTYTAGSATEANATVELLSPGTYTIELRVGIPGKDACPASTLNWTLDVLDPATSSLEDCEFAGCTNPAACNFNENANLDDGSCLLPFQLGWCNCDGDVFDALGVCGGNCPQDFDGDGICDGLGCLDSNACNFSSVAIIDDGSCQYGCIYCDTGTFWNPSTGTCQALTNCLFDGNADGQIGAADLLDFLQLFGQSCDD